MEDIYGNEIVQIIMQIDKAFEEQNYSDVEYRVNFKSEVLLAISDLYKQKYTPTLTTPHLNNKR